MAVSGHLIILFTSNEREGIVKGLDLELSKTERGLSSFKRSYPISSEEIGYEVASTGDDSRTSSPVSMTNGGSQTTIAITTLKILHSSLTFESGMSPLKQSRAEPIKSLKFSYWRTF